MNRLKSVASALLALFVDDGAFATSILLWVALCWLALPRLAGPVFLQPVILFAGLVVILSVSAALRALRR
jgi:hypothetical protein